VLPALTLPVRSMVMAPAAPSVMPPTAVMRRWLAHSVLHYFAG
jgi:hypothetical protein